MNKYFICPACHSMLGSFHANGTIRCSCCHEMIYSRRIAAHIIKHSTSMAFFMHAKALLFSLESAGVKKDWLGDRV